MIRMASLSLGSSFIALGVLWFYSSLLDDVLLHVAGPIGRSGVSDMSKMSLSDDISLMISGIAMTGVGLVIFGLYALDHCEPPIMHESEQRMRSEARKSGALYP